MHSIEPTISLAASGESGGGDRRLLLKTLASPLLRRGELRPPPAPAIAAQLQLATVATAWRCSRLNRCSAAALWLSGQPHFHSQPLLPHEPLVLSSDSTWSTGRHMQI